MICDGTSDIWFHWQSNPEQPLYHHLSFCWVFFFFFYWCLDLTIGKSDHIPHCKLPSYLWATEIYYLFSTKNNNNNNNKSSLCQSSIPSDLGFVASSQKPCRFSAVRGFLVLTTGDSQDVNDDCCLDLSILKGLFTQKWKFCH